MYLIKTAFIGICVVGLFCVVRLFKRKRSLSEIAEDKYNELMSRIIHAASLQIMIELYQDIEEFEKENVPFNVDGQKMLQSLNDLHSKRFDTMVFTGYSVG